MSAPTAPPPVRATGTAADRVQALADPSVVNVVKRNSLGGRPLQPGQDFTYSLTVQCSSLTTDCVNQTFTDVLPEGLDVTTLPGSTSTRTVSYDAATRTLTVVFLVPIEDPAGGVGLGAGDTVNFEIGMRLPAETPITTGTVIGNTASTVADNAPAKTSTNNVTVNVPRVVRPVTTKAWSDGSAVAGTDETSTITLGVRNASSTSAEISALTVTDTQPAMFENFDVTGATVAAFPAGADTAQLLVCTRPASVCADADYVAGPATTGTALALPAGTTPGQVTGVRVRFTAADGAVLPYDATGGSVRLGMQLRDTVRSTGAPLRPAGRLTVNNCAASVAADALQGAVTGAQACKSYDILPDTLNLGATKNYFADTDGNFANSTGEYAVLGDNSRVSGAVNIRNNSPFPIAEVIIREPGSGAGAGGNEFAKLDTDKVRVRYPAGATSATLTVTYGDGSTAAFTPANNATQPVAKTGVRVQSLELIYRGENADGDATIAEGSTAGLDLSGTLNDQVTEADLAGGTSPGVVNCAGFEGSAGRQDGTGTAAGNACATLDVRQRINTTAGVKSVGQTSVPLGQPIPFTLRVVNNGTLPLVNPVISDPSVGDDGRPDPAAPNPFDTLRITGASITKDSATPNVVIEVFDPTTNAWVSYDTAGAAVLDRATGIRARALGNLTPTKSFTLNLVTERRPGTPDDVSILNCFTTSAGGDYTPGNPACAPRIQTGPVSQAASLNKSIQPSVLPREVPGVPEQYANVILTLRNNGNLSMGTLQATDDDVDFFDAVEFVDFAPLKFPTGANRVRIDALVAGAWVNGTPSGSPTLPAGVTAASVQGIRATFSSTSTANGGYVITPCAAGDRSCEGTVTFRISPRKTLRSSPTTNVPEVLVNDVDGGFTTPLSPDPDDPSPIPAVQATLTLTQGTPKLDVDKTPNSTIGPGETAPFTLTVTNNGTANIPQLLVADVLPPGFAFDDSFVGDNGQPFKIVNAQVPAGTDPVPTPAFIAQTTGDRVSGLRFSFGDWIFRPGSTFQIQIQVGLEPGVITGQTLTNTMGATSATPLPDLQCTAGDPVVTDGIFGEGAGTFCTDTAAVTVRAGAAFSARKWVHGRDSLGWFNTRTQQRVAVGGRTCPSTTDSGGTVYTAYPCIALVSPGDRYDYYLRLTNSGTEPAREMRIIDKFPAEGDRGVILDQARLTQWNNRPTLATQPVLDGTSPGALSTTYTNDNPVCADDLNLDPDDPQCSAGDWDDAFGPANTGMQMRLTFGARLAPGGSVALKFSMDTPLEVDQVSDPTIAWNSFAHAETTVRAGGTDNYLPPTEPIKTGVALQYGTLGVTKAVGENPSNLPLDDVQFEFAYRCTITPQGGTETEIAEGSLTAAPGQTATVPGIPGGASCRVWETRSYGGVSSNPVDNPAVVQIVPYVPGDPQPVTAVTITNDFPDAVIAIRKVVTGGAAPYARDSYPVAVTCTFQGAPVAGYDPKLVEVSPGTFSAAVDVPSGAVCTAVETDTGQATEVSYNPAAPGGGTGTAPIQAESGTAKNVVITNDLRAGYLAISKDVVGPGAPELSDGPFIFGVACSFDGQEIYIDTVTLTGTGTGDTLTSDRLPVDSDGLPVGASCVVTETDSGGADVTPDPVTVAIPDVNGDGEPQTVTAGFTNAFSAGTLSITKNVDGAGADQPWVSDATFTLDVTCERENADGDRTTVLSQSVNVKAGQSVEVLGADDQPAKLPLGSHCYATESNDGGATSSSVDYDSYDDAVIVESTEAPQDLEITATNTFDLTSFAFTKTVDGPGASFADGRQFTANVTCTLDQGAESPTVVVDDQDFAVADGDTETIEDLPIGAVCSLRESDTGGATRTTTTEPVTLTADGGTATITNTFAVAELTVQKTVVNGDPGPYNFEITCRTDQGLVDLGDNATFSLSHAKQRTITVPEGATCTVRETDLPDDDKVSYTDTDGTDDGTVIVNTAAKITVTNTFTEPAADDPAEGGSSGTGNGTAALSSTGGPTLWWLLAGIILLTGGGTLLLRRRRS